MFNPFPSPEFYDTGQFQLEEPLDKSFEVMFY